MIKKIFSYWKTIVLLIVITAINFLSLHFKKRIDLTEEKKYSLSPSTKKLLNELSATVEIDVLLTGDLPADFKKLQTSTKDLLEEMKELAGNNFVYRFIDPKLFAEDTANQILAEKLQLNPYSREAQTKTGEEKVWIYPFAIIKSGKNKEGVDLLKGKVYFSKNPVTGAMDIDEAKSINAAEPLLEYKLAHAIEKTQQNIRPIIAYISGNGEPDIKNDIRTYSILNKVNLEYQFFNFDLNKHPAIPLEIAAIMIVKPTQTFSDSAKIKIDQYIMRGGKAIWFLDNLNANEDSLKTLRETIALDMNLNLDDLLFSYGVRINRDLIQDLICDNISLRTGTVGGQAQIQSLPYNYFPLLTPNNNNAITKNMEPVLGEYVNTIDTVKAAGIEKNILLTSSENSKTTSSPAIISLQELMTIEKPELYNKKFLPVAVALKGKFQSPFVNRIAPEVKNHFENLYQSPYTGICNKENKMIVVTDGDIVLNKPPINNESIPPMGLSNTRNNEFANATFLSNALEYLTGSSGIIEARNKDFTLRLLNKIKVDEEKSKWQIINIAFPIALILLAGIVFNQIRMKIFKK